MKRNIAIIILSCIVLLFSILFIDIFYKYQNTTKPDEVLVLPNEAQKNTNINSFSAWDKAFIYKKMSLLGVTNFDLDKSGFYGNPSYAHPLVDQIMPGVYYLPDQYFTIDVDFTTGLSLINTNMVYVPDSLALQEFFSYVDSYTNSDLKEFPGYNIKTCEEKFGESIQPYCYAEFYEADSTLEVSYLDHYNVLQIIQTALNPEHKAIQLYEGIKVYVPLDSIYYQELNDFGVLTQVEGEDYAILSTPSSMEITNTYDKEFIENVSELLPQEFEFSRYDRTYGRYYYYSFKIEDTHFKMEFGDYNYDELQEYIGDDTIMKPQEKEYDEDESDYCAYNDNPNPVENECYSEVAYYD